MNKVMTFNVCVYYVSNGAEVLRLDWLMRQEIAKIDFVQYAFDNAVIRDT